MDKQIWKKNLEALDGRYSYLKEALQENRLEGADTERQLTAGTQMVADRKILFVQQGDMLYQLDTLYDDAFLTTLWYKTLGELSYANKTVMFGFGNGMFARKYLEEADNTTSLLVYEPSGIIFRKVMEEFDISDLLASERLFVLVEGYAGVDFSLKMKQSVEYTDIASLHYRLYMNYDKIFAEESKAVNQEVQLVVNAILGTQDVMARHGESYYQNTMVSFRNLLSSKSLFDLHRRLPKDIPVFIAASGPSLDKNIGQLKKVGEKGLLLAADSAVPALLNHGIIPHLFASVDGQKNPNHFNREEVKQIPLVCELTSTQALMSRHTGPEFVINNYNKHIFKFFQENDLEWVVLESGGSVAHILFELAVAFGYRTIILVGQDLAYTDNKSHSAETYRGTWTYNAQAESTDKIEGYYGEPVLSSEEFKLYLRWFEGRIRECPQVHVINATEGGAKIHGAQQMPLEEAIENYCQREERIREAFDNVDDMFNEITKEKLLDYILRTPQSLEEAKGYALAAIRDYEKILELAHIGKLGSEVKSRYRHAAEKVEALQDIAAMEYIYNRNQNNVYQDLKTLNQAAANPAEEIITACSQGIKELRQIVTVIEGTIPHMIQQLKLLKNMQKLYCQLSTLLSAIAKLTRAARQQNYEVMNRTMMWSFLYVYHPFLQELAVQKEKLEQTGYSMEDTKFVEVTAKILKAQEQKDYVLMADYFVLQMKPLLESVMEALRSVENNKISIEYRVENEAYFPQTAVMEQNNKSDWNYVAEQSQQGPYTVRVVRGEEEFYLHSNVNPCEEAELFAEAYGDNTAKEYAVLGLGLGYHAITLWQRAEGAVPVHVYEFQSEILGLARQYLNFTKCRQQTFAIHYDPKLELLSAKLKEEGVRLVIHYPSLRCMQDAAMQNVFSKYFIADSSRRNQEKLLFANFYSNIAAKFEALEALENAWKGRDIYIIAAGPSLDKNIEQLRQRPANGIILAAGTVLNKLLNMGIRPDYVIVIDANERVIGQVRLHCDCGVPMLLLSTANYQFAKEYMAAKYLLLQRDFQPAEEYAEQYNRRLIETGGSVSTTALDVAIRLGAGRIIFLGLDLAFTDNLAHAADTSNRIAAGQEELLPVKAYDGGKVYTNYKFNIYAEWIERRLQQPDARKVRIINATEGGRYLAGMQYSTLASCLQDAQDEQKHQNK